ncbi:hypothetical protein ACJJTC_000419 [Scirpophaga incertulas]
MDDGSVKIQSGININIKRTDGSELVLRAWFARTTSWSLVHTYSRVRAAAGFAHNLADQGCVIDQRSPTTTGYGNSLFPFHSSDADWVLWYSELASMSNVKMSLLIDLSKSSMQKAKLEIVALEWLTFRSWRSTWAPSSAFIGASYWLPTGRV